MLILALNGSPHKEGNTALLLNAALEAAESAGARTGLLHVCEEISDAVIPFCFYCSTPCDMKCYRGTRLEHAFELMRRADGILLGSPVYFGTVSAPLKSFWDKTRLLRSEKSLLNVVGGALAVGASRFGGQETTVRALQDMMLCQGMIVVGDGSYEDDAGHQGACAQQPSGADLAGLRRSRILARRVVEVAAATSSLRKRTAE
ncbi:MAG TPA: flavodoxin family protein [Bacillota bacterium]|nr:flavodoxin family protein [Bacillota bacterium]